MPSPFPGMDPYLETPDLWPGVRHGLISQIQAALNQALRPHYVARIQVRIFISDEDDPGRAAIVPDFYIETETQPLSEVAQPLTIPFLIDEEIEEAFVEIRHRESKAVVAVIEVLSPSNKTRGSAARRSFLEKRREIIGSEIHWVEIDLLRAGEPSLARLARAASDYRIVVSRSEDWRRGKFWPVSVRQALPVIGIPLRGQDADVPLDLNAVLRTVYENAAYDLSVDYRRDPEPPLSREDAAWAAKLLHERGLR